MVVASQGVGDIASDCVDNTGAASHRRINLSVVLNRTDDKLVNNFGAEKLKWAEDGGD